VRTKITVAVQRGTTTPLLLVVHAARSIVEFVLQLRPISGSSLCVTEPLRRAIVLNVHRRVVVSSFATILCMVKKNIICLTRSRTVTRIVEYHAFCSGLFSCQFSVLPFRNGRSYCNRIDSVPFSFFRERGQKKTIVVCGRTRENYALKKKKNTRSENRRNNSSCVLLHEQRCVSRNNSIIICLSITANFPSIL
jgi:hypothetical protein